jgi:CO/xanthine dehydrogenase FAD-binding subunit
MTDDATITGNLNIADGTADSSARLVAALAEIERLRARVTELEAELAITHGSLTRPEPDEPATYVHDVPPNAPR